MTFLVSARKKIRVGVVGFGWMGQAHTRSILRIPTLFPEREFDAELVMISDNMASRVDQAVADFGFGHGSVDWNDLIANDDIDVVVICAPNMLHEPIAIAAAEAGKHVFCEKPVGGTPEQTVRIEAAAGGRCDHRCRIQLPMGAAGAVRQAVDRRW